MKVRIASACLFINIFVGAASGQSNQLPFDDSLILELMERTHVPGISIAVVDQDQIFTKSFGVRNADTRTLVNTNTIFEAASLTKPVTGMVAIEMVSEGLMDLDRPLYQYVDYDDLSHDERHREITARMVLNHTSGLPNGRRGGSLEIYADPGTKFGYSGEAFRYLQAAMESITKKTLDVLAEDYVFAPLGMNNSSYIWREPVRENAATGHAADGTVSRDIYTLNTAFAEGGLETSIEDYTIFVKHVLGRFNQDDVVIQEMFSRSQEAADHDVEGSLYWGLSWGLDVSEDRYRAWHTGSNGQFKSFVVIDFNSNKAVICFLNGVNGLDVLPEIVDSTIGNSPLAMFYQQTIVDSMNYPKEL